MNLVLHVARASRVVHPDTLSIHLGEQNAASLKSTDRSFRGIVDVFWLHVKIAYCRCCNLVSRVKAEPLGRASRSACIRSFLLFLIVACKIFVILLNAPITVSKVPAFL